jgi:hypothetical protein
MKPGRVATPAVPEENMSDKPTQFEDVQLNDAELDQVVGGQEVLALQMMGSSDLAAPGGCWSSVSCESSASCKSSASSQAAETL